MLFMSHHLALAFALLFPATVLTQTFDAGVVRRSGDAPGVRIGEEGGPGTDIPGRYRCSHCPLMFLLRTAYSVDKSQIIGPPWLDSEPFDVTATFSASTAKAAFRTMLRNLLIQSLDLQAHREWRQVTGYDLVVSRRPIKIRRAPDNPNSGRPWVHYGNTETDAEGFPLLPQGVDGPLVAPRMPPQTGLPTVPMLYRANQTMAALATQLSKLLKCPVRDNTGLEGRFQVSFEYPEDSSHVSFNGIPASTGTAPDSTSGPPEPGVSLAHSLQERLGLKLVPRKVPWEVIIIDHLSKIPHQQ